MMLMPQVHDTGRQRANRKTAFALLTVALVLFFGIMLRYWLQQHA